ncbi:MAG: hypothetical protein LC777_07165 [Actinobacteria bacterium]|nr:hypothetical protein [Actinomycetota bacterium]
MTRPEALKRCDELQADTRASDVRWIARQTAPGSWSVVRLRVPGLPAPVRVIGSAEHARPQAPDPRPLVNPFWTTG